MDDVQFIADLFEKYKRLLFHLAYSKLNSKEDAEDILQEVFVIAIQKQDILKRHNNPSGWLIQTMKYVTNNYLYHETQYNQAKKAEMMDYLRQPLEGIEIDDMSNEWDLTPAEFKLIYLKYCKQQTCSEIALEMGLKEVAVKQRLSRIRKKIKNL